MASQNPKLLLNLKFVKGYAYPYLVFTTMTGIIFCLVLFIDLLKYIFVASNCKFTHHKPSSDEESLNIGTRLCQVFIIFTLVCFLNAFYHMRKMSRQRRQQANKAMTQLNKSKKRTWNQV